MTSHRALLHTLTAGLALALAGCANFPMLAGLTPPAPAPAPPSVSAPASAEPARPVVAPIKTLADDKSNRYVRLDAANTGLVAVADDGLHTFAVFASEPKTVEVYNEDGKPIRSAASKNVLAIEGKHKGVLFTSPSGNSFAAPNPRAPTTPLEVLSSDPDVAEARMLLEGRGSQGAAYQRALALATGKAVPGAATPPRTDAAAASSAAPPNPTASPAAANEDLTFVRQDYGVLMRVFFASGGRSVVRPDDGLVRLVREAMASRQIRITGYTDNLGSSSWNSALAQQRAEAIRNHLIKAGVAPERIVAGWRGATDFIAENLSEKGRALNRRVEVQMIQSPQ